MNRRQEQQDRELRQRMSNVEAGHTIVVEVDQTSPDVYDHIKALAHKNLTVELSGDTIWNVDGTVFATAFQVVEDPSLPRVERRNFLNVTEGYAAVTGTFEGTPEGSFAAGQAIAAVLQKGDHLPHPTNFSDPDAFRDGVDSELNSRDMQVSMFGVVTDMNTTKAQLAA